MVHFANPEGHNWGAPNYDVWGILQIVFAIVYTIALGTAAGFVWLHRNHPVIQKRSINLAILSIAILHVYLVMIFMVYPVNGNFPCSREFWIMSTYLPVGMGLFQAQNQQLLIVSREQKSLLEDQNQYKPLYKGKGKGIGGPRYIFWRLKLWWQTVSAQHRYEGVVAVGIFVQLLVTLIIFEISRKWNEHGGIVSEHVSEPLCRRGWEWLPSIFWQFLWNWCFGPYLLWKIRMIDDIYNWRLQTTLAIIASIPGTPLWIAGVYSDSFATINKWVVPSWWLVPGLIVMQTTTLAFPILQIFKHKQQVLEVQQALADFETKKLNASSTSSGSLVTRSTISKRRRMYSMESLDECLASNYDGLQIYASCQELNGENIIFLVKVLTFKKQWLATISRSGDETRARYTMFCQALSIYVQLIHSDTAKYPINIESNIYNKLESMFGGAALEVASRPRNSISTTPISVATPWDEPEGDSTGGGEEGFPMNSVPLGPTSAKGSTEHILPLAEPTYTDNRLASIKVPDQFDETVFDAAFKSIRYMVWSETWQRYQGCKRTSTPSLL